jgi:hypothetical protein
MIACVPLSPISFCSLLANLHSFPYLSVLSFCWGTSGCIRLRQPWPESRSRGREKSFRGRQIVPFSCAELDFSSPAPLYICRCEGCDGFHLRTHASHPFPFVTAFCFSFPLSRSVCGIIRVRPVKAAAEARHGPGVDERAPSDRHPACPEAAPNLNRLEF